MDTAARTNRSVPVAFGVYSAEVVTDVASRRSCLTFVEVAMVRRCWGMARSLGSVLSGAVTPFLGDSLRR
jgi:hypothetical protein